MTDTLRLIQERRGDAVVLPAGMALRRWMEISQNESLDLPVTGAMGKASSMALGLCLAQPERKVIVVDGDGGLLMNLGSLVTVAGQAPENLYHFVLDNGMYAVTGGQPVPNAGGFTFAGLARMAGYATTFEFEDLEELSTRADEVLSARGPVLASIKTVPEVESTPIRARERGGIRRTPDAIKGVIQALQR